MTKRLAIVLVSALILSLPSFAGWGTRGKSKGGAMKERGEQMAKELDLTEAQKNDIKKIREKYKADIEAKKTAHMTAMENFKTVRKDVNASSSAIQAAFDAKTKTQTDLHSTLLKVRLEIREILTPEQRKKAIEKMDSKVNEWKGRMRQRMGESHDSDDGLGV